MKYAHKLIGHVSEDHHIKPHTPRVTICERKIRLTSRGDLEIDQFRAHERYTERLI